MLATAEIEPGDRRDAPDPIGNHRDSAPFGKGRSPSRLSQRMLILEESFVEASPMNGGQLVPNMALGYAHQ